MDKNLSIVTSAYETNLHFLALEAMEREEENGHFLRSLKQHDSNELDNIAHALNDKISSAIDCTQCGNCCKTLVVSVEDNELDRVAQRLNLSTEEAKDKYIEESMAGNCYLSSIPCHFLAEKKCSIYEQRFTDCREFPHLHKPGFRERFLGTLMHYGSCPIIYNVVEEMKVELGFLEVVEG